MKEAARNAKENREESDRWCKRVNTEIVSGFSNGACIGEILVARSLAPGNCILHGCRCIRICQSLRGGIVLGGEDD
jgi:hypothetical protein